MQISTGTQTERQDFSATVAMTEGTETQTQNFSMTPTIATGTETEGPFLFSSATTIGTGAETERQDFSASTSMVQGTETQSESFASGLQLSTPQGTETESAVISASGSATYPQGSETETAGQSMSLALTPVPYTITDSSGNNRHGTVIGLVPPSLAAGDAGFVNALQFEGVERGQATAGVLLGTNEFEFTGSQSFTVELRAKRTGALSIYGISSLIGRVAADTDAGGNWFIDALTASDLVRFGVRTAGATAVFTGTTVLGTTNWHHIELSYDGTTNIVRGFIDGVFQGKITATGGLSNPADTVKTYIGRLDNDFGLAWNGLINGVRISNAARHATDSNFTPPSAPYTTDGNTVGLWQCDKGSVTFLESQAVEVSAVANLSDYANTATNTRNAGSTDWTSLTNAQGAFNDTEAAFALAAGVVLTTGDATLKLTGFAMATPSGFTTSNVFFDVRYRWELTILLPSVDTARVVVTLRDSGGTSLSTLATKTEDDAVPTQETLVTESFDITSLASEAQIAAGLQIWVQASASLSLATSGNMSAQVDGARLRRQYTRSGIQ